MALFSLQADSAETVTFGELDKPMKIDSYNMAHVRLTINGNRDNSIIQDAI